MGVPSAAAPRRTAELARRRRHLLVIKRLILLGVIALACGAGVRLSRFPGTPGVVAASAASEEPTIPSVSGDGRAHWESVWTRPAPDLSAVSIASDGSSVAWLDRSGAVRRLDGASGKTLWQTPPLAGMNRLAVAPEGDVFVYSNLNRLQPRLRMLDRNGGAARGALYPLDGAVWSLAIAGGGSAVFVGTGKGTIYSIPLRPNPTAAFARPNTWTAEGIPQALAVAADASPALVSTWETHALSAWNPATAALSAAPPQASPSPLWHADMGDPARGLRIAVSQNGTTALCLSDRGARGDDPRLEVWDAKTGALLWQESFDGYGARAQVSADGKVIAITYAHLSDYNSGSVVEHKLSLFSRDGTRLFREKGGLYFSPELVALSQDGGRVTVQSGRSIFYTLDGHGNFRTKLALPDDPRTHMPPTVRDCQASTDGQYLLVVRGDGQISLFRAVSA